MPVRTKHLNGTVIRERSAQDRGMALWSPVGPADDRQYLWPGRGAGLFLVDADGITPVTHPAARGQYGGLKQARGALARLLAARAAYPARPAGPRGSRGARHPVRATRCTATRPALPDGDLLAGRAGR
jgi:hypothetical protein